MDQVPQSRALNPLHLARGSGPQGFSGRPQIRALQRSCSSVQAGSPARSGRGEGLKVPRLRDFRGLGK